MTTLILLALFGQFRGSCAGGSCGMPSGAQFSQCGPGGCAMPSAGYALPPMAYAPAYAPAAPTPRFRWSMQDATGKWWGADDLSQLLAHVERTDARQSPAVATRYVLYP